MTAKTVRVNFIEKDSDEPFASSDMALEQLPETFQIDTVLDIAEDKWQIIEAKPQTKDEFSSTGVLNLYLIKHEVHTMDPKDILFSISTINESLPEMVEADSLENIMVFREDDWRRQEFISDTYSHEIAHEFEAIKVIYDKYQQESGFTQIHLRKAIENPIDASTLTIEDLQKEFSIVHTYRAVAFTSSTAIIKNSFAFEINAKFILWGNQNDESDITTLNLYYDPEGNLETFKEELESFVKKFKLYFVDWEMLYVMA